jgi:hypothetical protein
MGREISWVDTMVLLNALVWHDLGNIRGREGHANEVHALFKVVSADLYDESVGRWIRDVAEAHSGPGAIERCIPKSSSVVAYHSESVNLRFLAAVLRFADELDEDRERIPTKQYASLDLVPVDSQRYWFFNSVNSSIRIVEEPSTTGVYVPWVEIHSEIPQSDFSKQLPSSSGGVEALEEYFFRILKIEQERQYCNPYLRTGYSHAGVGGIRVNLDTRERDSSRTSGNILFELSDTSQATALLEDPLLSSLAPYLRKAIVRKSNV